MSFSAPPRPPQTRLRLWRDRPVPQGTASLGSELRGLGPRLRAGAGRGLPPRPGLGTAPTLSGQRFGGTPPPGLVRAEPGNVHFAETRGSSQDCVAGLPGPFVSTGARPSFPAASTPLALGCPAPAPGSPELTRTPHLCLPCPRSSSFPREPQLLLFIHPQNSVGASLRREGRCGRDRSHFSQVIAAPPHTHIHTFLDPWGDVSPSVPEDRCPGAPLAALAV